MTASEALNELGRLHQLSNGADDSVYSEQERAWIDRLRRSEFGEPVRQCTCRNRYTDAVLELLLKLKRTNTMQEERKYILKRGRLIWIGTEAYTCHNITDEVAAEYLRLHPDGARHFERMPAAEPSEVSSKAASTPKSSKTTATPAKAPKKARKSKVTK